MLVQGMLYDTKKTHVPTLSQGCEPFCFVMMCNKTRYTKKVLDLHLLYFCFWINHWILLPLQTEMTKHSYFKEAK